jgi:hypothetical protein
VEERERAGEGNGSNVVAVAVTGVFITDCPSKWATLSKSSLIEFA